MIDAHEGEVLGAVDLDDGHPEGYTMLPVAGRGVVLNGSYGQDGSRTWFLRVHDGRMDLRSLGWGGIASSVDPARAEILAVPHDDTVLEILGWWDAERALTVDGDALFEDVGDQDDEDDEGGDAGGDDEPDGFGYWGAFLDAERLVASTWSDRVLVLSRADGAPQGWLDDDVLGIGFAEHVAPGRLLVDGAALIAVAG